MGLHYCEMCGIEYYVSAYRDDQTRVCSFDCERERRKQEKYKKNQSKLLSGFHEQHSGFHEKEKNPRWSGADGDRVCRNCGKNFRAPPCRTGKYCSKGCHHEAMRSNSGDRLKLDILENKSLAN